MHSIRHLISGLVVVMAMSVVAPDHVRADKATTTAQLKLGHFATADGMYGFTLDRTGSKAKLKIDGEQDIIELTMEEDRDHGTLRGYRYVSPDNKQRIYITQHGSIIYYRGGDEHWVTYDKEAQALGAATIKGAPVKPVPAYEKLATELRAISVRVKLPKYTTNDASSLEKVTEVYAAATVDMFVRYKDPGKAGSRARLQPTPSDVSGASFGRNDFVTDDTEDKRHGKLAKHGGVIRGYSSPDSPKGNHIIVDRADTSTDLLLDKTPGLIWEVDGSVAVFVALDGGRYRVDLNQGADVTPEVIERGAGPQNGWPKSVADTFLDMTMVSALGKAGAVAGTTMTELDKIDDEWTECVAKGWTGATAKFDAGNLSVAQTKAEIKKLHTACNKHIDRFEVTLVKFIDERSKARATLFTAASARAKSVGATK